MYTLQKILIGLFVLPFIFSINASAACKVTVNIDDYTEKVRWIGLNSDLDRDDLVKSLCEFESGPSFSRVEIIGVERYYSGDYGNYTGFKLTLKGDGCKYNVKGKKEGNSTSLSNNRKKRCSSSQNNTYQVVKSERNSSNNNHIEHFVQCGSGKMIVLLENTSINKFFVGGLSYGNMSEAASKSCN